MSSLNPAIYNLEQSILALINRRLWDEAREKINSFIPRNTVEGRLRGHWEAKIYFHQGQYLQASINLEKVIETYGEHITALGDLSCSYYLQGDFYQWARIVSKMESAINRYQDVLDNFPLNSGRLLLGKYKEEMGEVDGALSYYRQVYELADDKGLRVRALSDLVRCQAQWEIKRDLPLLYSELSTIHAAKIWPDLAIEMGHALLLGDFELVGLQHALENYQRLVSEKMSVQDHNLLLLDFLECCLRRGEIIPEEIHRDLKKAENLNVYEKYLQMLANKDKIDIAPETLISLAGEMPMANYLKILLLYLGQVRGDWQWRHELKKKTIFLLDSIPSLDRSRWKSIFSHIFEEKDNLTGPVLDPKSKKITFQDKKISFVNKATAFKLLLLLANKKELSLDGATQSLWGAEFNESYYHRLRILAGRANKDLFQLTAYPNTIKITKEKIWIEVSNFSVTTTSAPAW
ncbi:MAG: hypothetical protein WCG27_07515 [Pseudomonadota bacterium]